MSTSSSLDFNLFYELTDPFATRALRLTVRDYSDWISTDYSTLLFRGKTYPEIFIKLRGYMGRQIVDFFWSDLIHILCISNHVMELLQSNGITGWATYPVEVYGRKGEFIPDYHGFAVTGSECFRDRTKSQIITRQAVPEGKPFQVYKGLYFYEKDWDGSDIFIVRKHGGIVVTEKVKRLLKQAKVTNIRLIPIPEVERDVILDKYE